MRRPNRENDTRLDSTRRYSAGARVVKLGTLASETPTAVAALAGAQQAWAAGGGQRSGTTGQSVAISGQIVA